MDLKLSAAVCVALLLSSAPAIAYVDCSGIDPKSTGYQTCMLRKESYERDQRVQIDEQLRQESQQKAAKRQQWDASYSRAKRLDDASEALDIVTAECKKGGELGLFIDLQGAFDFHLCANPSRITVFGSNQADFARDVIPEIEKNGLVALFLGSTNITRDMKSFTPIKYRKSSALRIEVTDTVRVLDELKSAVRSDVETAVFFKNTNTSQKYLVTGKFVIE